MDGILKFKDVCNIKLIEEKYSIYTNVDVDDFLDAIENDTDLINSIIEKFRASKGTIAEQDVCASLIELREIYEKHKQMYLNINLDFEDDNKEELLFNLSCIYDYTLDYIESIDNLILIDSDSVTGGFLS